MRDLITQPDIDQRESLETIALAAVPAAVDAVTTALARLPSTTTPEGAEARLARFSQALFTAVLTLYVQGALSVDDRDRLIAQTRDIADRPLVHEVLRTVRLVGVDALGTHVQRTTHMSRAEHLRLRESAERVEALLARVEDELPPPRDDVLRRLQATGFDLR